MTLGLRTSTTMMQQQPTNVRLWRDILRLVSCLLLLLGVATIAAAARSAKRLNIVAASHNALHSRAGGRALLPFPPNQVLLNMNESATATPFIELRGGRSRRRQISAPVSPSTFLITSIDWGEHELNASTARIILIDLARNKTSMPTLTAKDNVVWIHEIDLRPSAIYVAAIFGVRRSDNGNMAEAEPIFAARRDIALSGSMLELEQAVLALAHDDDALSTVAKSHIEEIRAAQSLRDNILPAIKSLPSEAQFAWAFRTNAVHRDSMIHKAQQVLSRNTSIKILSSESQRETRRRRHSSRGFLHLMQSLVTAYQSFFLAKSDVSSTSKISKRKAHNKERPKNVHFGTFRAPLREDDVSLFSTRSRSSENTSGFWRLLQRLWHEIYVSSSAMSRKRRPFLLRLPLTADRHALLENITTTAIYIHHRNADRSAACRASLARVADAGGWAILVAERPGASRLDALRLARALLSGDLKDLVRLAKSDVVALLDALALLKVRDLGQSYPFFLMADRESAGLALSTAMLAHSAGRAVNLVLIDPDPLTTRAAAIVDGIAKDAQVFSKLLRFALVDGTPAFLTLLALLQGFWDHADGSLCRHSASVLKDHVLVIRTPTPASNVTSLSSVAQKEVQKWGPFPVVTPSPHKYTEDDQKS
eukprot:CAMPEP_0197309282 /NCGR_PEP_ID=MMETSP0891-20130614/7852_1 /TAXON_ID=44058 ORGANISM="Aureoumbra lagunensis, Strain CCMP1510" /NCGR_SAMPLE_ID=MMETSP0891 /ASSEMBLY_ACC=CAM_ASM_000534 /LENGTH=649 /DNA_ID=CAMNT_0042794257 /DNA_START=734 /DNA_END=2679 /DNA_ORIENTATION=-